MRAFQIFPQGSSFIPQPGEADRIHFVDVNPEWCRSCGHCEGVCPTGAIQRTNPSIPWCVHHIPHPEACIACGQCLKECPGEAIEERVSFMDAIQDRIHDPSLTVAALVAPSIRYTIGESFGDPVSRYEAGKMVAALHRLGFDLVWDVQFGADVTVFEEGEELLARLSGTIDHPLPLFTSCCPAWVRYVETYFPTLIPHLSSARSPAQIVGALAKTYGAKRLGIAPENLYTVQIMPCIAKKFEALRIENARSGFRDIDATLDTREVIEWLIESRIDFDALPDEPFDPPFEASSGAATLFGATGGVMEAVLRYGVEKLQGTPLEQIDFIDVRGNDAFREAELQVGGRLLRVAVINGAIRAAEWCQAFIQGETRHYDVVEVMACPGGCLNGGGQPIETTWV